MYKPFDFVWNEPNTKFQEIWSFRIISILQWTYYKEGKNPFEIDITFIFLVAFYLILSTENGWIENYDLCVAKLRIMFLRSIL